MDRRDALFTDASPMPSLVDASVCAAVDGCARLTDLCIVACFGCAPSRCCRRSFRSSRDRGHSPATESGGEGGHGQRSASAARQLLGHGPRRPDVAARREAHRAATQTRNVPRRSGTEVRTRHGGRRPTTHDDAAEGGKRREKAQQQRITQRLQDGVWLQSRRRQTKTREGAQRWQLDGTLAQRCRGTASQREQPAKKKMWATFSRTQDQNTTNAGLKVKDDQNGPWLILLIGSN